MSETPRKIIRNDIVTELRAAFPGLTVLNSFCRDIPKDLMEFVSIFSPSESVRRPEGGGEGRTGRPVMRDISIDVLVCVQRAGEGVEAAEAADDIARQIEIFFNENYANLQLTGVSSDFEASDKISCLLNMSYVVSHLDNLGE